MESFGECRGCRRNIKFAVKQARLCRTCYNKTYLTSQKRREYYKNKKKRRDTPVLSPIDSVASAQEDRGDHHQHHSNPDNQMHQDPVGQLYHLLNLQQQSCSDCVPRLLAPSNPAPALSLAALAHASQQHQQHVSSPASPGGQSSQHLSSSSTPSSPSNSSSLPYQELQLQYQHQHHLLAHSGPASPLGAAAGSSPRTASSASTSPYGSPPTATALLHDLLQQVSAFPAYYAALAPALGLATPFYATAPSTPETFSRGGPSAFSPCGQGLPSSFALLGGAGGNSNIPSLPSLSSFVRGSTNPLPAPTATSHHSSFPLPSTLLAAIKSERACEHCSATPASAQRVGHGETWLCDACHSRLCHGASQPATRSPAIKNLLN